MSATTKIAVHSLADLKNTTDDALPNYLHSLKFRQIHSKTDIRLILGYTAVTIAGILFYFDWKFGWEATKAYTAPAVVVYFVLNAAFTYWMFFVERGVVFEGEGRGRYISIRTHTKKHIPIYECDITFQPAPYASNPEQTLHIRAPFTRWFTSDGYFIAKPFQQWLASEVPIVGRADPNNVVEEIGRGNIEGAGGAAGAQQFNVSGTNALEILEQLKASAGAQGASTGQGAGAGGRRRKA